jgi:hypothetical protein
MVATDVARNTVFELSEDLNPCAEFVSLKNCIGLSTGEFGKSMEKFPE